MKAMMFTRFVVHFGFERQAEFFTVTAARCFARRKRSQGLHKVSIFDYKTRRIVPVEPRHRKVVQDVMGYTGKVYDAPRHILRKIQKIHSRANDLAGTKRNAPTKFINQARLEWVESLC
jgi:hypothetical protein